MGNNQPKYLNSNEAIGIMGDKTWERLRRQLRSGGGHGRPGDQHGGPQHNGGGYVTNQGMDYNFFSRIVQSHFEYIPRLLLESLFLGFAADLNSRVDIDEFIASLAVISGQNRALILKFLFHIYDCRASGHIDRVHVEKVLKLANIYRSSTDIELKKSLDALFRVQTSNELSVSTPSLTYREFEQANVPLRELGEWVQTVLLIFTDPLPVYLAALDKKYTSNIHNADIMDKYKVSEAQCANLRAVFAHKASISMKTQPSLGKQEVSLDTWIIVVRDFLSSSLATMTFLVSSTSFKAIWRLEEFLEFCFVFGRGSIDEQAQHLCQSCYRYYLRISKSHDENNVDNSLGNMKNFFRRMILFLAQSNTAPAPSVNNSPAKAATSPGDEPEPEPELIPIPCVDDDVAKPVSNGYHRNTLESLDELSSKVFLPAVISDALDAVDSQATDPPLQFYVDLLATYSTYLPGMRELEITACCLFGVQPGEPSMEKEFIMELMVKRQSQAPQNRAQPYGPVGTEWCVIVHSWWDSWRFYVGHKRVAPPNTPFAATSSLANNTSSGLSHSNSFGNLNSASASTPKHPGEIDNWSVLKKSGPKQLLQGTTLYNSIEIIPPSVYHALQMWYGGGPRIQRKVIYTTIGNIKASELELFPLCIKICTCLADGRAREPDREMLMSRMQKISQIIADMSEVRNIDVNRVRLWNYAQTYWKEQYVLSPDLTLEEAKLQDGQTLLLEVSLNDGTWPRSQLHSQLDEEERMKQQAVDDQKKHASGIVTKQPLGEGEVAKAIAKSNDGRIGLDNLGNTCYLNASLQALLHTEPLVEYFMSQAYLRDINMSNRFGYGGKLAISFGKLVEELYRSNRRNITPRHFINELASIHQQFGGNQQHDAQELLAFLLDGLSEDLNLVDEKPYTMQPDSDGRPDSELADIWWENHFKRDLSLIQALFTGQFKSIMTCRCGYSSARFEPFNILTVPIPEDFMRMFTVHVVFQHTSYALLLTIRVDKRSDLASVVEVINRLDLPTTRDVMADISPHNKDIHVSAASSSNTNNSVKVDRKFVAVEIINSKVHAMFSMERKLDMIRDGDNIFLYETTIMHRGMQHGVRSVQLPPVTDPMFDYSKPSEHQHNGQVPATMLNESMQQGPGSMKSNPMNGAPLTTLASIGYDDSPASKVDSSEYVNTGMRVAFVQRRIRLQTSSGIESFALDIFGLPFVHVVDSGINGKQLYDLVFESVGQYLKASISDLKDHYAHIDTQDQHHSNDTSSSLENTSSPLHVKEKPSLSKLATGIAVSASTDTISSFTNEEVFASGISRTGFTLRVIVGGMSHCIGCVRCHWLARCSGCVIPDNNNSKIFLRDGETIAIDWHVAVFEELLDINAASEVKRHKSLDNNSLLQGNTTPLKRCLDKFTEEEPLEGMVCPRCHDDDKLRKSFAIWRLPPVLVIQLKRFQFDNTSRKKLTNRVDFPLEDFDLSEYLASKTSNDDTTPSNDDQAKTTVSSFDASAYDLYCTVHHIGALSGGHYITAVKCLPSDSNSNDKPSWCLFNDDVTSEIKDLTEICSPSAYLLFYVRKDIQKMSSQDIFLPFRTKAPPRSRSVSIAEGSDATRSRQSSRGFIGKLMPRHKSYSLSSNNSGMSTNSMQTTASAPVNQLDANNNNSHQQPGLGKSKSLRRSAVEKVNKKSNSSKSSNQSDHHESSNSGCLPS